MCSLPKFCFVALLGCSSLLQAAIVGTNPPAKPLTFERIAALPITERQRWNDYLQRSERQSFQDHARLNAELLETGAKSVSAPPETRSVRGIPLDRAPDWYRGPEALRLADIILSFQ